MAALHFLKSAPSLLAQLMPVHLPRLGQSPPGMLCQAVIPLFLNLHSSELCTLESEGDKMLKLRYLRGVNSKVQVSIGYV